MSTTQEIVLSEDQGRAKEAVLERLERRDRLVTLGGYAGTGKTTLIAELVPALRGIGYANIAFCSYTGKAKEVLAEKLTRAGVLEDHDYCGTLHGLLYHARQELVWNEKKKVNELLVSFIPHGAGGRGLNLIVVDEASMVDEAIFSELREAGLPILAVGDHGQLPPVNSTFNLMQEPMVRLERIHRQAEKDPIIRLAEMARTAGRIPVGQYGPSVLKTDDEDVIYNLRRPQEWMFLCGTNATRGQVNKWIRPVLGFEGAAPVPEETLICLRNNRQEGVFNGMRGRLKEISFAGEHHYRLVVEMDGFTYRGTAFKHQFAAAKTLNATTQGIEPPHFRDLWDFGYCLTVHKAQGSEAEKVVVFEESRMKWVMERERADGWRRWLYTAVTRAKSELILIGG